MDVADEIEFACKSFWMVAMTASVSFLPATAWASLNLRRLWAMQPPSVTLAGPISGLRGDKDLVVTWTGISMEVADEVAKGAARVR